MTTGSPDRKSKHSVEVQLLGQRMVLKAEEDPRQVERLVSYVKRKIDELSASGPISSSKLAVLAALNIADDYFRAIDETRELKRQVAMKSRALLGELERRAGERVLPARADDEDTD
jgi:cell division protein ZapA (FtsZ GTPase activity inhibitor)